MTTSFIKIASLAFVFLTPTLALATNRPIDNLHIVFESRLPMERVNLEKSHQSCMEKKGVKTIDALSAQSLDAATVFRSEDFFSNGRYAHYETQPRFVVDKNTCNLVDQGAVTTVKIEDENYRLTVDLNTRKGARRVLNQTESAQPMDSTLSSLKREMGSYSRTKTREHHNFAGQGCDITISGLAGPSVCQWENMPYYFLGKGHKVPIEVMSDVTLDGKTYFHREAIEFHYGDPIPEDKFVIPSDVTLVDQ